MKDKASTINWRLDADLKKCISEAKEAYGFLEGIRREHEIVDAIHRFKHKHGIK